MILVYTLRIDLFVVVALISIEYYIIMRKILLYLLVALPAVGCGEDQFECPSMTGSEVELYDSRAVGSLQFYYCAYHNKMPLFCPKISPHKGYLLSRRIDYDTSTDTSPPHMVCIYQDDQDVF